MLFRYSDKMTLPISKAKLAALIGAVITVLTVCLELIQ